MPSNEYPSRVLYPYAVATAGMTWFLLVAGGMVTSTDSGLAVPDWPLSYGQWMPPMVGGIFYEHGHRMVAAVVGLMILGLAIGIFRLEPRAWVKRLAACALLAVVAQALLGGLTVRWLLPPQVSIAHACLGQTVFCLVVCLARATSPRWAEFQFRYRNRERPTLGQLGSFVVVLLAMQLALGAMVRHTGRLVSVHLLGAAMVVITVGWLVRQVERRRHPMPGVRNGVGRLIGLICIQVMIGVFVLEHHIPWLRTSHVAVGALILAQAVVLAWDLIRCAMPQPAEAVASAAPSAPPSSAPAEQG